MTKEEQALTLLAEANPVPDLDSYGTPALSGTDYLAGLEQEERQMIDTDRRTIDGDPEARVVGKRNIWIAAAAVLLVVTGLVIIPNLGGDEVVDPAPVSGTLSVQILNEGIELTADIEECPLEALRNDEPVQLEVTGIDESGAEWAVMFDQNVGLPNRWGLWAESPEGDPFYKGFHPAPITEVIADDSATYTVVLFDDLDPTLQEIAATVVIECDG